MVHAMEVESVELSDKAQVVANFLESENVNIEDSKKAEIINYFNGPDSGIPMFRKIYNYDKKLWWYEKVKNSLFFLEESVFNYPLSQWKLRIEMEWARLKGRRISYPINCKKEDTISTALLKELRKNNNIKLPKDIRIPVFKRLPSERYPGFTSSINLNLVLKNGKNYLNYCIKINAEYNEKYLNNNSNILNFNLAHEIAHAERGNWRPYRNMLLAKIGLFTVGGFLSYIKFKNTIFESLWKKPCIYGLFVLFGVLFANNFNPYFKRLEEKACDLRAIEICKSGKGLNGLLLEQNMKSKYLGNNHEILDVKFEKLENPLEYTWLDLISFNYFHPSPAARIRYCEEYAKKHGYPF